MVTHVPTNRQTRRHRGTGHSHLLAIMVTAACCFALHKVGTCCTNNRNQRLKAALLQTAGSSSETVTGPATVRPSNHAPVGTSSAAASDLPPCIHLQAAQPAHGKRVLVTGAAGFIGYHTCKALATQPDTFVLGLDNFNGHYSPGLKLLRQQRLHHIGVNIVTGDIRNETLLQELFACYRFTQVVHLAARAGVRQSGTEAGEYASSNVVGTAVLLEVMRKQQKPVPSIVYASSSSVYGIPPRLGTSTAGRSDGSDGGSGLNSDSSSCGGRGCAPDACCCCQPAVHLFMPQAQHQQWRATPSSSSSSSSSSNSSITGSSTTQFLTDLGVAPSRECSALCGTTPASVYAATKVATEKLVAVYVHQYKLKATGLRFFTVYGPLGRPDMAVMSFTRKLLAGEPIDILCFPVQSKPQRAWEAAQGFVKDATQQAEQEQQQQEQKRRQSIQGVQFMGHEEVLNNVSASHSSNADFLQVEVSNHSEKQQPAGTRHNVAAPPSDCIPTLRDFTAVSDVVCGLLAACNSTAASLPVGNNGLLGGTNRQPAGQHHVYNIGFGQPHSTLELLQHLQQLLGVQGRVRFVRAGAAGTQGDVWATWADTTAAQRQLGFKAAVGLGEGLQEFVGWYVSDAAAVQHL